MGRVQENRQKLQDELYAAWAAKAYCPDCDRSYFMPYELPLTREEIEANTAPFIEAFQQELLK